MNRVFGALLVLHLGLAAGASAGIVVREDRFSQSTEVASEPMNSVRAAGWLHNKCAPPALLFGASVALPGSRKESMATLSTLSVCDDWKYLSCHKVSILVDGKPLELGTQVRDGTVVAADDLREIVTVIIPFASLKKLVSFQKLELQQCRVEWEASTYEQDELREFASKVLELLKPAPSKPAAGKP